MRKLLALPLAIFTLGLVLVACSSPTPSTDPFENAMVAYKRHDSATAAKLFQALAEQGDDRAQIYLAGMYWLGSGVPKDILRAYMWWNLAASSNGPNAKGAAKARDDVVKEERMTPAQIAQAQEMTSACRASNYKQCGQTTAYPASPVAPTNASPVAATPLTRTGSSVSVPMKQQGGTFVVPVRINQALVLDFTVDSGATDVTIPADVVRTLVRTGTIRDADFIGQQTYVLADGSKVKSHTFRIRSLQVGDKVVENVVGSIASVNGSLLLGQSFLGRFKSWSIDNTRHTLVLE